MHCRKQPPNTLAAASTLAALHNHIPAAQLARLRETLMLEEAESVVVAMHVQLNHRARAAA